MKEKLKDVNGRWFKDKLREMGIEPIPLKDMKEEQKDTVNLAS